MSKTISLSNSPESWASYGEHANEPGVETVGGQYFTNQPASLPFQRSGSGLDHAAAGLIAQAAFSQAVGQAQLVETGEGIIVVRTDTVTPAPKEEQSDMSETMQAGLNRLVKADIASAFALALSETYQLELNPLLSY